MPRQKLLQPKEIGSWKNHIQTSNKRQQIIYALDTGWNKRDQSAVNMAHIENQGQSLNADGDRNYNSLRNGPVDSEKIHSRGFQEIAVNKGIGPPTISVKENNQNQKDMKFYGSIEPSTEEDKQIQRSSGTAVVANTKSNVVALGDSQSLVKTDSNRNMNDIGTKIISVRDSTGSNAASARNDFSTNEPISNSNGGNTTPENSSQDKIIKGAATTGGDANVIPHVSEEKGDSKSVSRDPPGTHPATVIIMGQPNVQMVPFSAGQVLGQSVQQGSQPFVSMMPVIPPQGNLFLPMMQQPADNADKRGMFLQPMQQWSPPLMYNPIVMPSQPQYFSGLPQYPFTILGQTQSQDPSNLLVSSLNQNQQQQVTDQTSTVTSTPNLSAKPTESTYSTDSSTDSSTESSSNRWVDGQGYSRNEVMEDSEGRAYEEQKEREREESDERERLYGNDNSDDDDRDEEEEEEHSVPRLDDFRDNGMESEGAGDPRDDEEDMFKDEDYERYNRLRNSGDLGSDHNFQGNDVARMRFLHSRYPTAVQHKFLQSHYAHSYPADDMSAEMTRFSENVEPPLTQPLPSNVVDMRQDSSEFRFSNQPQLFQSREFSSFVPEHNTRPSEPAFPDMSAEAFSRYQVSNPESELKPKVLPISLPYPETNAFNKNKISSPANMEVTQMTADQARFLEGQHAELRNSNSPLSSKNKIPRSEAKGKLELSNTMILLNGKPLEDAAQLRSRIVNGKIVQGKGKIIKSKGPVKVRVSHTKDSRHMKVVNIIAPQQYRVIDTKDKIRRPKTTMSTIGEKAQERISDILNKITK